MERALRDARVVIVKADRATAMLWNRARDPGVPTAYVGWYWLRGNEEGGPFPRWGAAARDAWWRFVMGCEAPRIFAAAVMPEPAPKPTLPPPRTRHAPGEWKRWVQ